MSNYYEKRDARVIISKLLERNGFKLYGYKPDQSDYMTDYYSPADWDGIATKGQYIAVVDNKNREGLEVILNASELQAYREGQATLTAVQRDKIAKLQRLADKTTFEGEKENALSKIEGILENLKSGDIEKVEAIREKLNFPATNYMFFIWDTEAKGIVYKSTGITDWDISELEYFRNEKLEWTTENRLKDVFDYKYARKYHWNEEQYTTEELDKIRARQKFVCDKTNDFMEMLENLDNLKTCYRWGEVKKGVSIDFEPIQINTFEDIEANKENLFIENYAGEKCKLAEIKEGYNYDRKLVKYAIFKKIKKDGTIANRGTDKSVNNSDHSIKYDYPNYKFYTSFHGVPKGWRSEKRAILLETDVKAGTEQNIEPQESLEGFEIIENEEQKGFEVKFDKKPSQSIINNLKENGFRWSGFKKVWWIKQNRIEKEKINKLLSA